MNLVYLKYEFIFELKKEKLQSRSYSWVCVCVWWLRISDDPGRHAISPKKRLWQSEDFVEIAHINTLN
jgi:hypothetical protein